MNTNFNRRPQQKTVTVFGGTGFIGRYLIDHLADQGWTVIVATRRPSAAYFLRTSGHVGQIVPQRTNIFNDADIEAAIEHSDLVVNLVGILADSKKISFDDVHHAFPTKLAEIAKKVGVERFVHVSALGADQNAPSRYQQSKALGELGILKHFPTANLLRPSIVFGEGDGFFTLFRDMATVLPILPLIGGGTTRFQPVYVGDVVDVIMHALLAHGTAREAIEGKVIELGGPDILTFKEMLQLLLKTKGMKRYLMPLPWMLARLQGRILQNLPGKLLTLDQVYSLEQDNVVSGHELTFDDINITPKDVETILPEYI